jgi:hypothetical protein
MNNWCVCWFFTHVFTKFTVQEASKKFRKAALRGGIYSGIKGLTTTMTLSFLLI